MHVKISVTRISAECRDRATCQPYFGHFQLPYVGAHRWCHIQFGECDFPLVLYIDEIIAAKCKTPHFTRPHHWSSKVKLMITEYYDTCWLEQSGSQKPTYPVMYPFSVFLALRDHNPLTIHADKQPFISCSYQHTACSAKNECNI